MQIVAVVVCVRVCGLSVRVECVFSVRVRACASVCVLNMRVQVCDIYLDQFLPPQAQRLLSPLHSPLVIQPDYT
jgi:hypothetical protein